MPIGSAAALSLTGGRASAPSPSPGAGAAPPPVFALRAAVPGALGNPPRRYPQPSGIFVKDPLVATLRAEPTRAIVQAALPQNAIAVAAQRAAPVGPRMPSGPMMTLPARPKPSEMIPAPEGAPPPYVAATSLVEPAPLPQVANPPTSDTFASTREGAKAAQARAAATEGATVAVTADNWLFVAGGLAVVGMAAFAIFLEYGRKKR